MVTPIFCRLYGLTIASPFPLPGAATMAHPCGPDDSCRIVGRGTSQDRPDIGETDDGGFCLLWESKLRFVIAAANDRIIVYARPDWLQFAPTVIVGVVFGHLLQRRGVVCLHGAVLAWPGRTIALLGPSGAGKSTTAAALVLRGAELVSDDIVAIRNGPDGAFVEAGPSGIRLTPGARSQILADDADVADVPYLSKVLWTGPGLAHGTRAESAEPRRLDAIYILNAGESVDRTDVRPLAASVALGHLLRAWYPPGSECQLTQSGLNTVGAIVKGVPVLLLSYSKRWDTLPELLDALTP